MHPYLSLYSYLPPSKRGCCNTVIFIPEINQRKQLILQQPPYYNTAYKFSSIKPAYSNCGNQESVLSVSILLVDDLIRCFLTFIKKNVRIVIFVECQVVNEINN